MPNIVIDGQQIAAAAGQSVWQAAAAAGIAIPSLCYRPGQPPNNACLVCVVRIDGGDRLLPSCATPVRDGMVVDSQTPELAAARRTAIELLLSEHCGDCLSPCTTACPLGADVPGALAAVSARDPAAALAMLRAELGLVGILGCLCHRPCESACRRRPSDGALAIRMLERSLPEVVAPAAPAASATRRPEAADLPPAATVAVIGSSVGALGTAFFLRQYGCAVSLYSAGEPAAALRAAHSETELPTAVLARELAAFEAIGGRFLPHSELAARPWAGADAVVDGDDTGRGGAVPVSADRRLVHSIANAKTVARDLARRLGGAVDAPADWTCRMGRLDERERALWTERGSPDPRAEHADDGAADLNELAREGARCWHCECRSRHDCALRAAAAEYGAEPRRFSARGRYAPIVRGRRRLVLEPGKCIACGICVQIARQAGERHGAIFLNRGFDMRLGMPFGADLDDAFATCAQAAAAACPTGCLFLGIKDKG